MITLTNSKEKIGFVFINGAGLNRSIWDRVVEDLDQPYLVVDYPFRDEAVSSRKNLRLADYIHHMAEQVKGWETQKFIIVAHSLGGVLALGLASQLSDRVAGLAAVGAAVPKGGGSFVSIFPFPKRVLMSAILRTAGTKPPEFAIRTGLCNDLSEEQASRIVEGFVPESLRVYTDRVQAAVPDVPRLYVKLTQDKEFRLPMQDAMIANLSPHGVESLDTGHLPMLSDPDGLKRILEGFASKVEESRFTFTS